MPKRTAPTSLTGCPMFLADEIEILRPDLPRGRFRSVLFDFDGTLSLIREGWPQVMIPMMVDVLRATGTRETEAELSRLTRYFGGHVYGALDDYHKFSKQMIIERILKENDLHGEELLGFGDGFVEVEEVRGAGGVAVAVASDEVNRRGVNAWKR